MHADKSLIFTLHLYLRLFSSYFTLREPPLENGLVLEALTPPLENGLVLEVLKLP